MYLNSIYYGGGAYGVEEVAKLYFDKKVQDLTIAETAILAALPQSPSKLSPQSGIGETLKARQQLVLEKMEEQGYIDKQQKEKASVEKIQINQSKQDIFLNDAPHFAIFIRDYLFEKYGEDNVNRLGFRVKTTLDLSLQQVAQTAVKNQVNALSKQKVTNGGVVIINPQTGEILALVGSYDWSNEQFGKFNVAFAKRQPGSAFKPIVYVKAIIDGAKTTDILHDKPTDFKGYKPRNYDGKFRGDVTLRRALANSLNVPSVELLQNVGIVNAINLARDMGITTLADPSKLGLSLVLGGGEVELFELTCAYGVLAAEGIFNSTSLSRIC